MNPTHKRLSQSGATIVQRAWQWLTQPSTHVPPAERRSAYLLSAFLIVITILSIAYEALYLWLTPYQGGLLETFVTIGALAGTYVICRLGHVKVAAVLTIIFMSAGVFGVYIAAADVPDADKLLSFLIIPVLIGNIFLRTRYILGVVVVQSLVMVSLPAIISTHTLTALAIGPLPFLWITTAILMVANRHRDQLEYDRQRELTASETRLNLALNASLMGVWEWELATNRVRWSPECFRIFGLDTFDGTGDSFYQLIHPDDLDRVKAMVNERRAGRAAQTLEYRIVRPSGGMAWISDIGQIEANSIGHSHRLIGTVQDITERKRAEAQLREAETLYRTLVEQIPAITYIIALNEAATAMYVSPQAEAILGYPPSAWVDDPQLWSKLIHPEDVQRVLAENTQARMTGEAVRSEFRLVTRGGGVVWCHDEYVVMQNSQGAPLLRQGVLFNITERKRAEALQEATYHISEATHQARHPEELFHAVHTIVGQVMPARNFYIALYDHQHDLLSYPYFMDEIDGSTPAPPAPPNRGLTEYVLRTGQPLLCDQAAFDELARQAEVELIGAHSPIWLGVPLTLGGRTFGVMAVQDYTNPTAYGEREQRMLAYVSTQVAQAIERQQAQVALRESEARVVGVINSALDAVIIVDERQRISMFNPAAEQIFGISTAEAVGQTLERFIPEQYRSRHAQSMLAFGQSDTVTRPMGRLESLTALRADGQEFPIEASISSIMVGGEKLFTVILRDITKRKEAERQIQEHARHQQILAEASQAFAEAGQDYARLLEVVVRHITDYLSTICLVRLVSEDGHYLELTNLHATDPAIQAMFRAYRQLPLSAHDPSVQAFHSGQPTLLPVVEPDPMSSSAALTGLSDVLGTYSLIAAPLRAQGQALGVVVLIRHGDGYIAFNRQDQDQAQDLADRAALAIVNARLLQQVQNLNAHLEERVAERTQQLTRAREAADRANAAKSEFLSRMSHELRTPLNAILGFAQLLGMDQLEARSAQGVQQILRAGKHLLGLINEVLDITRIESGNLRLSPEPVSVPDVLNEAVDLTHPLTAKAGIQLELPARVADPGLYVQADHQGLKQVLVNLLANAIKYNRPAGKVAVSYTFTEDHRLCIRVRDTGSGIATDKLGRLFTPFDRLGAEQGSVEGTGLGLALSRRLAEAMGGRLGVESVVGQGSVFWIELPMVENPVAKMRSTGGLSAIPEVKSTVARTVLYVEDNLSNVQLVEQILGRRPTIQLLVATSGLQGLELMHTRQPDLLLLDLNLPDMDGLNILQQLKADPRTRAVPVVVISADATPQQAKKLLAAGASAYLTKPLNISDFLRVMDKSLL